MSAIKLATPSSGSISLSPANTASNLTITVPAVTGTMAIQGPAFSAYLSATQTYSNVTFTKATFDTEDFDTNNNFASSRFTPTVAGYYQLNASTFQYAGSGVMGVEIISIYKNGVAIKNARTDISSAQMAATISSVVYANGSTDYFEIYVYTSATSPALAPADINTWFNGSMVRAA